MDRKVIKKISAGGVLVHRNKYLVIKWPSQGTTELPKGTIEVGETAEQACIREMREETGYNVRVLQALNTSTFQFDWKDGNRYEKTVHYFLMKRVDNQSPVPAREEGEDFENEWLSYKTAMERLIHEDMKEALRMANEIITHSA